ncbi:MAG: hypothetical protein PHN92_06960 [Geobacter sp.]|nr:hypothetical protein [Geobacter sp.]
MNLIHIIEPTLNGTTGHCYSFVQSICQAAGAYPVTVWCDHRAQVAFPPAVTLQRHFKRRIRRLQALWLYARLLRQPGLIFVATAGRTDLLLLELAALRMIPAGKVVLYVHWFNPSPSKYAYLQRLARRQPNLSIFAPTSTVCEPFRRAGFHDVRLVPYPITAVTETVAPADRFEGLLFAGAARYDKGFVHVVDLVERLAAVGEPLTVRIQTSGQHYDKQDPRITAALERLERIAYNGVVRYDASLAEDEYRRLFRGTICLQLYAQQDFADRISGVTLDALSQGCPILTLEGTWIARVVAEFEAGLVLATATPDTVLAAVQRIRSDYRGYSERAVRAGQALQQRNSAALLIQELIA